MAQFNENFQNDEFDATGDDNLFMGDTVNTMTSSPSHNFQPPLTTINPEDIDYVAVTPPITIRATYAVRRQNHRHDGEQAQIMTQSCKTVGSFYKDTTWWWNQINTAKLCLGSKVPFNWAKEAGIIEFTSPQAFYYYNSHNNLQVAQRVDLPLTPEKLSVLPTPAKNSDGTYRIKISFETRFGTTDPATAIEDIDLFQRHLKLITPAAQLYAETFWTLPHHNRFDKVVYNYMSDARSNFLANCQKAFHNMPLEKLADCPKPDYLTPPTSSNNSTVETGNLTPPTPSRSFEEKGQQTSPVPSPKSTPVKTRPSRPADSKLSKSDSESGSEEDSPSTFAKKVVTEAVAILNANYVPTINLDSSHSNVPSVLRHTTAASLPTDDDDEKFDLSRVSGTLESGTPPPRRWSKTPSRSDSRSPPRSWRSPTHSRDRYHQQPRQRQHPPHHHHRRSAFERLDKPSVYDRLDTRPTYKRRNDNDHHHSSSRSQTSTRSNTRRTSTKESTSTKERTSKSTESKPMTRPTTRPTTKPTPTPTSTETQTVLDPSDYTQYTDHMGKNIWIKKSRRQRMKTKSDEPMEDDD